MKLLMPGTDCGRPAPARVVTLVDSGLIATVVVALVTDRLVVVVVLEGLVVANQTVDTAHTHARLESIITRPSATQTNAARLGCSTWARRPLLSANPSSLPRHCRACPPGRRARRHHRAVFVGGSLWWQEEAVANKVAAKKTSANKTRANKIATATPTARAGRW